MFGKKNLKMSSENRGSAPPQMVPVYTLYPGNYQGNEDYGFHPSHPQAPPPKYEDVINGRPTEQRPPPQPPGTYEAPEHAGVIFVAPVYKYTKIQRAFGLIFTILFLVTFVSVLIKVLSVR